MQNRQTKPALYRIFKLRDGAGKLHDLDAPLTRQMKEIPEELSVTEAVRLGIEVPSNIPRVSAISQICTVTDKQGNQHEMNIPMRKDSSMLPPRMTYEEAISRGIAVPSINNDGQGMLPSKLSGSKDSIYKPQPIDRRVYAKVNAPYKDAADERLLSQKIYHLFVEKIPVRMCCEKYYVFNESKGLYEEISSANFDRLIHYHFGSMIEANGNLHCYDEIRDYISKDHRLNIQSDMTIPLEYWNFRNGIVDITNGTRIQNNGQLFVRNVLQGDYRPGSSCPTYDEFLISIAGGDNNLVERLWEITGYFLSRDTNAKAFFAFIGEKDTGKSLLAKLFTGLVGSNAVSHLSAEDFSGRFDLGQLNGKLLNVSMDLPNRPLSPETVGKIKSITGNDDIYSDVKYGEPICFRPTTRLLFGANSVIRTELFDPAFAERMIVVPFNYPVPKNRQDHHLLEKLLNEAEGICMKAISYYLRLVDNDYQFTEIKWDDDVTLDYDKIISDFINQCCVVTENKRDRVSTNTAYQVFNDFCMSKTVPPLSLADFSKRFRRLLGNKVSKKKVRFGNETAWGFEGLKLSE